VKAAALTRELPALKLVSGDLLDASGLIRATELAHSWTNPRLVADVNGGGVLNMLEAMRFYQDLSGKQVRFYQASTSEMFGKVQDSVQSEKTLLWPRSPYGVAKAYGHHLTINYRESYGMHASSGILFNHESPRRGFEFVTRKVSHGVARISLGLQDTISSGILQTQRDWGFAGDYVEAMYLMLQHDQGDDYVIATGDTHSIIELLDAAFSVVGISDWARYVEIDPAFARPSEVDVLIGDASKASSVLGWKPKVSFLELVEMMVHHDIKRQASRA
jgi:GDPmannose 4,6-dehydratase